MSTRRLPVAVVEYRVVADARAGSRGKLFLSGGGILE
jgi:hypothetical protein